MIVSSWFSLLRQLLHCGGKKKHISTEAKARGVNLKLQMFLFLPPFLIIAMCLIRAGEVFQRSQTKKAAHGEGIKELRFGTDCNSDSHKGYLFSVFLSTQSTLHWTHYSFTPHLHWWW